MRGIGAREGIGMDEGVPVGDKEERARALCGVSAANCPCKGRLTVKGSGRPSTAAATVAGEAVLNIS